MTTVGAPLLGGHAPADARDLECQWLVPSLFHWLSDKRVRRIAVNERAATEIGIATLGGLLHMALMKRQPVDPKMLKRSALDLVCNRRVRRRIGQLVLERQAENLGLDPLNTPPKKSARDVMRDLQDLRKELEAEFESGIVRPF